MTKYFNKNSYTLTFIYKDFTTELLEGASISIDMNSNQSDNIVTIEMIEKGDTSYLFMNIGWIILDLFEPIEKGKTWSPSPITRKIFEVNFNRYKQDYFYVSKNNSNNFAEFKLEFLIKNMVIEQDAEIISLEQLVRVLKIGKLID
jgi:hypothetical protein